MPVDENTRLRLRQYLIELMDEEAADAMMESMPPIPWTELATKDDITRLDGRLESLDRRVEQTSSDLQELTRVVALQGASLGARMDSISDRLDGTNIRIDGVSDRIDTLSDRIDGTNVRIDTLSDRLDGTNTRVDGLSERIDGVGERIDIMSERMSDLGRTLTVGFFSMALTLAVFMIGTIASLFAAGAFG